MPTTGAISCGCILVRRTRSFIKDNYAKTDPANGRRYLAFDTGERFYFP